MDIDEFERQHLAQTEAGTIELSEDQWTEEEDDDDSNGWSDQEDFVEALELMESAIDEFDNLIETNPYRLKPHALKRLEQCRLDLYDFIGKFIVVDAGKEKKP